MKNSLTSGLFAILVSLFLAGNVLANIYTFTGSGNWSDASNWAENSKPPSTLLPGDLIIINGSSICFLDVSVVIPDGVSLTLTNVLSIYSFITLDLKPGATLTNNSTLMLSGTLIVGGTLANNGTFNNNGNLVLDAPSSSLPSGTFNWYNGAKVTIGENGSMIRSTPWTISTGKIFEVLNGGSFTNNSSLTNQGTISNSGIFINNSTMNSYGTFNLKSGGNFVMNSSSLSPLSGAGYFNWYTDSKITVGSSGIVVLSNSLTIESGRTMEILAGGSLSISSTLFNRGTLTNYGTLTNNGTLTNYSTFSQNGIYKGSNGKFNGSLFTNPAEKILAPGNSAGCLIFNAGLSNSGTVQIELSDGYPCSSYDKITVTGDATIDGIIEVSFMGTEAPSTSTFTILTATGNLTGNPVITWPDGYTGDFNICTTCSPKEFQLSLSALPIELEYFLAIKENRMVHLSWRTSSEQNNRGFEIQTTLGQNDPQGTSWEVLGFVAGHGTSTNPHDYYFLDENPSSGINFYRLRQMDDDGPFKYSRIVSMEVKRENEFTIYPNPTAGVIFINGNQDEISHAKILDHTGRLVRILRPGQNSIDLTALPAGMYFISLQTDREVVLERLLKE